jgi:hypothetical protein
MMSTSLRRRGYRVLEARRSQQALALLTMKQRAQDIVDGLDAGADDYIVKPFNAEELRARVQVGVRIAELQSRLTEQLAELTAAFGRIRRLHGLLPICSYCKKIRGDRDYWEQLEEYLSDHSDVQFSHAICPECYHDVVQPSLKNV